MDSRPPFKINNIQGIALFLVLAAVSTLSILVGEFAIVARVSQNVAYNQFDQLKAHYTAKGAFKLSLLRLKIYQQLTNVANNPQWQQFLNQSMLEQIWSAELNYPFVSPALLSLMQGQVKDEIEKFQKNTAIAGSFSATITSESSKFNLNQANPGLLAFDGYPKPSPAPSTSRVPDGGKGSKGDPYLQAVQKVQTFLTNLYEQKLVTDREFSGIYQGFQWANLLNQILNWMNPNNPSGRFSSTNKIIIKQAPFYTISELHMVPGMDDDLFELLSQNLTVSGTQGLNINTLTASMLAAIVPGLTPNEITQFFSVRDSQTIPGKFATPDSFLNYLQSSTSLYGSQESALKELKSKLTQNGNTLITNERYFKIKVYAEVSQASRTIEAWLELLPPESIVRSRGVNGELLPTKVNLGANAFTPFSSSMSGLRITYLRVF